MRSRTVHSVVISSQDQPYRTGDSHLQENTSPWDPTPGRCLASKGVRGGLGGHKLLGPALQGYLAHKKTHTPRALP